MLLRLRSYHGVNNDVMNDLWKLKCILSNLQNGSQEKNFQAAKN